MADGTSFGAMRVAAADGNEAIALGNLLIPEANV